MTRWLAIAVLAIGVLAAALGGAAAFGERVVAPAERAAVLEAVRGRLAVPLRRDLWVFSANGTNRERLTALEPGRTITGAAWAPDGQRLALSLQSFVAGRAIGVGGLYLTSARGGEPRLALSEGVPGALFEEPSWTPDGAALVYAYQRHALQPGEAHVQRLERAGVDGADREVLVDDAQAPGLGADGHTLAFVRRSGTGAALLIREPGADAPRTLVASGRFVNLAHPRFAPDGTTIAFAAALAPGRSGGGEARSSPLAHAVQRLLAPPTVWAHGLPMDVWLVGLDGSDLQRLTELQEDDPSLAWSPDGGWLAVLGARGLYVVARDGRRLVRLAEGGDHGRMDWGP